MNGRDLDEKQVDASEAKKRIMRWVRLAPNNIEARVAIVVEHFRQNVGYLLGGRAKAMVVTASRLEAVRWMQAMTAYIADKQYSIGLMVAFSGVVEDTHTETTMNPGLHGQDIREAFAGPAYQILIVANKFQTGFDQPLLCAMYVDRKLGGIQAVQTLSRLNRAAPGKETTIVVDFVNDPQAILEAFRQYHTTAELADVSDPNVILDLRVKLDSAGYYDQFHAMRDLGRQTLALSGPGEKPLLQPITDAGSGELQDKHKETLAAIVSEMSNLFGADVTDTDKVTWFEANFTKVAAQPDLQAQAQANTEAQFLASPSLKPAVTNALIDTMDAHQALSHEALNSQAIQDGILAMFIKLGLYDRLRAAGGSTPGRLP